MDKGIHVISQLCFKLTVTNGRRYTLATSREDALEWVAYLTWYENSSKLIHEWREMWGARRRQSVTLRDYINAAAVIVKIGQLRQFVEGGEEELLKAAEERAARASTEDKARKIRVSAKKDARKTREELELTDRDRFLLSVLELTPENAEAAGGAVLKAMKTWVDTKVYVRQVDHHLTGGVVGGAVSGFVDGVVTAILVCGS